MEFRYKLWCEDIRCILPGVVFKSETLPLDEVLETSSMSPAVKDFFNFPFLFSFFNDWSWWWSYMSSRNGVFRSCH